ncbi:hypothetical protein QN219_09625 [Sinorhizobium sp. 7-81]|uniref:hypothetical protein n=1 Tax=Sinorhizobium sp. 8-89 TaxID=3049089 RepID=UPI0024C3F259|nr:hypothetical protein [Sinorhizobium sp. 8-89]MDK1490319.1 hypothetical protein [Sinorhizobium sp. 8-89]
MRPSIVICVPSGNLGMPSLRNCNKSEFVGGMMARAIKQRLQEFYWTTDIYRLRGWAMLCSASPFPIGFLVQLILGEEQCAMHASWNR